MHYVINIFPVTENDTTFSVDNHNTSSDYFLQSFIIEYNVFDTNTSAQILLRNVNGFKLILSEQLIKVGQVIQVIEYYKTSSTYTLTTDGQRTVFLGYIQSIVTNIDCNSFTTYKLICNSILSQLNYTSMINTSDDIDSFGVIFQNVVANQISLEDLLNGIKENTLLKYVKDELNLSQFEVSEFAPFTINDGTQTSLPDQKLWIYTGINENRASCLLDVLYPYQRLLFQAPDGEIIIQPPFINDTNENYNINLDKQNINQTSPYSSPLYHTIEILQNTGTVNNRIINTFDIIVDAVGPVAAAYENNSVSYVATPNEKYFKRAYELLNSGYFNQSVLNTIGISGQIWRDTTLLTYLDNKNFSGKYINKSNSSIPALYAQRQMAQNLVGETIIQVAYPRETTQANDLPLAQIININTSSPILDVKSFFCFKMSLEFNNNGDNTTILNCSLCKPYTYTALWDNFIPA